MLTRVRRRMMDQHDATHRLPTERDQNFREPRKLFAAELSGRHEWPGRQRRGQRDERERAAAAHEGEYPLPSLPRWRGGVRGGVPAHVVAPVLGGMARGMPDVGVVI